MSYWYKDELLQSLLPILVSTTIKGLSSFFQTPKLFSGANVLPEGDGIGPSPIDIIAARCPKKRAFIVTDEIADRFAGRVQRAFARTGFVSEVWNGTLPEAPLDNVKEAAQAMSEYEPDMIIAVGGGSVMDLAKAAWVLYERPDITDLTTASPLELLNLRQKALFTAVPTTSGTGSECTMVAVVTDKEANIKVPLAGFELMPDFALLVPEFTESMPPKLTVGTGLDVLAHATDCVMVSTTDEMTRSLGLTAVEMVFQWLPRAYRNGKDREARHRMLLASSMAGMAFGNSNVALTHALGHALGAVFNLHHGFSVGLFIPYVLQYYRPITDKWLPLAKTLEVDGQNKDQKFANLIKKIRDLYTELEAPLTLKDLSISEEDFEKNMPKLVADTMQDITVFMSARPISEAECEQILRYAYEGKDVDF